VKLAANQSVSFKANFKPIKGDAYTVNVNVGDKNGQHQVLVVSLTTPVTTP
jgi:hypothetical protein